MERKMFGKRIKTRSDSGRVPGQPENSMDESSGKAKDNPKNYEGKEHVKYRNPGFTRHKIRFPQDEPHMKSHVGKEEMHEMEDNFHMKTPDQTEDTLPAKIKRAMMKMDAPDQEDPKPLRGNIVHEVGYKGEEDTDGEEQEGPNMMQGSSKDQRKKMVVAIAKRKMKKGM
jgi:hypothetical protein